MAKKKSQKRTPKEEARLTDQDTQYDVVAKDEASSAETLEEVQVQQVIPEQVETQVEAQPETTIEATTEAPTAHEHPQELKPKPKPLTMISLRAEIDELRSFLQAQSQLIADLMNGRVLKRKPVANSRVMIKDTQTGKTYPSKNNTYKSLLKAGELKDLVDQGILGDTPDKNSFGWYAINRYFKSRFVEVKSDAEEPQNEAQ